MLWEEYAKAGNEAKLSDDLLELLNYRCIIISHFHWKDREEYFFLIEEILTDEMKFSSEFLEKREAIEKELKRIELELEWIPFEPDPRSEGFTELIDDIISVLECYCPDPDWYDDYDPRYQFSEQKVHEIISEIFLEMKNSYS